LESQVQVSCLAARKLTLQRLLAPRRRDADIRCREEPPAPARRPTQADATRARKAPQSVRELAVPALRPAHLNRYRAVAGERGLDVSSTNER